MQTSIHYGVIVYTDYKACVNCASHLEVSKWRVWEPKDKVFEVHDLREDIEILDLPSANLVFWILLTVIKWQHLQIVSFIQYIKP
jgi:hypothetical protein